MVSSLLCGFFQVYLSNMPLADLAAAISEEEQGSSSSDEDEQDFTDDEEAAIASAVSTSEDDSVRGEVQNHPVLQSSVAAADEQPASAAAMEQLTSDEDQLIPLGVVEASYAADASALGMAQDDDVSEASTLVVRKGQQLQELLVSGSITQEQLRHEVEKIVSFLLSPEDVQ